MTQKLYWTGEVPEKDDFGYKIENTFYDGKTRFGPWATMSFQSWTMYCARIGTGICQKYERQPDGRWLKVEG